MSGNNDHLVQEILANHALWLSDSTTGKQADFSKMDLTGYSFLNMDLQKANFEKATLVNCDFRNCNLEWCNFRGANMRFSVLANSRLKGSNIIHAILYGAIGDGNIIRTFQTPRFTVNIISNRIQIGCKWFSMEELQKITVEEASLIAPGAGEWWGHWRDHFFKTVELYNSDPSIEFIPEPGLCQV